MAVKLTNSIHIADKKRVKNVLENVAERSIQDYCPCRYGK